MNLRGGEVLPDWKIRELMQKGVIIGADESLVNPSSLDLRVSAEWYKVLGSFLPPEDQKVEEALKSWKVVDDDKVLKSEFFVDTAQPYIVKLMEGLKLPGTLTAKIHNKSGRGRIGISVKGLADKVSRFDNIPSGYKGGIYAEICATKFPLLVKERDAIPQIVFYNGNPNPLQGLDLDLLLNEHPILTDSRGNPSYTEEERKEIVRTGQFTFNVDLSRRLLIYRAKGNKTLVLSEKDRYEPHDFFEPVRKTQKDNNIVVIYPGDFVLIKSKEHIRLPPEFAAEISGYSIDLGDLRTHYAGWINASHGYDPKNPNVPSYILFEVRARDTPVVLRDGQNFAKFVVHRMLDTPKKLYMAERSTNFDDLRSFMPGIFKKK